MVLLFMAYFRLHDYANFIPHEIAVSVHYRRVILVFCVLSSTQR